MSNPRVSVVMPAFNREKFISSTIDSILMQSYEDFELIIVDDGSTDDTVEVIKQYDDPRIRLIEHAKNHGVATARNTGYRNAKGEFIVIADSDDLSHPDRLLKKITFLDQNPQIDVVSCWYQEIDNENNYRNKIMIDSKNDQIRANWIFNPAIPSFMMFRKEKVESRNLLYHDVTYKAAVDYQWYTSLDDDIQLFCIPEVLYYYRRHEAQISTDGYSIQQKFADEIRLKQLKKIGVTPTSEEFQIHRLLNYGSKEEIDDLLFRKTVKWCENIKRANEQSCHFKTEYLNQLLVKKLHNLLNSEQMYSTKKDKLLVDSEFSQYLDSGEELFNLSILKQIAEKIDKPTFIFGTKKMGYIIKKLFEQEGTFISNFVDNNKANHHKQIENCKVLAPWEIDAIEEKIFIISIVSNARFVVKEQLIKKYGVQEENIFTLEDLGYGGFKR